VSEALRKLLANPRIWRGQVQAGDQGWQGLASGYSKLDRLLPGGGWPLNALTEILLEHYGTGELQLLMPALAHLSQPQDDAAEAGWITWVAPPFEPYPPALQQWGVNLSRVLIGRRTGAVFGYVRSCSFVVGHTRRCCQPAFTAGGGARAELGDCLSFDKGTVAAIRCRIAYPA
jgi:hypothetical protein